MRTISSLTGLPGIRSSLFLLFVCVIFSILNAQSLDSAVTRDTNGNGYLDAIDLFYSSSFSFPATLPLTNISVSYVAMVVSGKADTVRFSVSGVSPTDSTKTKYVLTLLENTTSLPDAPQTAWRPNLGISGTSINCMDGAGPVIWSVVKAIVNVSDRTQDVVQVTFSEPIQSKNGTLFIPAAVNPKNIFYDYRKNADGSWDTINIFSPGLALNDVDSLYINSFNKMVNDSTLEFIMSNGKDLTTSHYLNINAAANQIFDSRSRFGGGPGVATVADNQKVQVKVFSSRVINPYVPKPVKEKQFLSTTSSTKLTLYSVNGQKVKDLSGENPEQLYGSLMFLNRYGQEFTNGVYFLVIQTGSKTINQKVIIAR
jgi:hypothetical protein